MKRYGWEEKGRKAVYKNPFMRVVKYDVIRPSGERGLYWVLDRGDPFSIIIPLTETNETYLVGQYRLASDYYSWEFPMGAVAGKKPLETAKQELKEETGLTARKWEKIGKFFVAHGHTNQKGVVFIAKKLTEGVAEPEDGEFLEIKKMPIEKVGKMIKNGKILDSPTITAYHLFLINYSR